MRNDRRVRRPGGIAIFYVRKMAVEVSDHSAQGFRIAYRNRLAHAAQVAARPTALAVRDRDGATADFRLSGASAKEIEPVLKPLLAADAPAPSGH